MAHSILKNRVTDSLFCNDRIAAAKTHIYLDLQNSYKFLFRSILLPSTQSLIKLNLFIAHLPLYTIRKLPFCLPGVRPVEFYRQQWLDDVQHLLRTRHKLLYSIARIPDATLLAWNYGVLVMLGINRNSCGNNCECKNTTSNRPQID